MSDATQLEGRYRRLLAFYPQAFRREREQEMLSVLIAGAAEGQRRPSLDEAIDLLRSAIFMRLWWVQSVVATQPALHDLLAVDFDQFVRAKALQGRIQGPSAQSDTPLEGCLDVGDDPITVLAARCERG